jgi:hypothetical protein
MRTACCGTNGFRAEQNIETTRELVVVDVVGADDTHRDAVEHLTGREVHAVRHHKVRRRDREGILVECQRDRIGGRCRAFRRPGRGGRNGRDNHVLIGARENNRGRDRKRAGGGRGVRRHDKRLLHARIGFRFRVDAENVGNADDVAGLQAAGERSNRKRRDRVGIDRERRRAGIGRERDVGAALVARQQRVFEPVEAGGSAELPVAVLRLDLGRVLEQPLEGVHHVNVVLRLQAHVEIALRNKVVHQDFAGSQRLGERRGRTEVRHAVVNVLVHLGEHVALDVGRQNRHRRVDDTLREIIQ